MSAMKTSRHPLGRGGSTKDPKQSPVRITLTVFDQPKQLHVGCFQNGLTGFGWRKSDTDWIQVVPFISFVVAITYSAGPETEKFHLICAYIYLGRGTGGSVLSSVAQVLIPI